jgi:hypothetical protein
MLDQRTVIRGEFQNSCPGGIAFGEFFAEPGEETIKRSGRTADIGIMVKDNAPIQTKGQLCVPA